MWLCSAPGSRWWGRSRVPPRVLKLGRWKVGREGRGGRGGEGRGGEGT